MKANAAITPTEYRRDGIRVRIRPTFKKGTKYFVADYRANGQRKLVWRSSLADARAAAAEAVDKIVAGQSEVLELTSSDRHVYLRAQESLVGIKTPLDAAAREYAEAVALLAGRASLGEVCREWLRRHAVELPKITVAESVVLIKADAETDRKSDARQKQLANVLDRFADSMNVPVQTLEPNLISKYLAALPLSERSKRNHRDVLGFYFRWLVLKGYLPKGTDMLEGVQNYTARKLGEISTYTAEEMRRLIAAANDRILPLIVIGGFAGLRHAEINRLEWQDIDLEEGFIEVKAHKAKTDTRRIVPLKENLKAFLLPLAKRSGKVVALVNTTKQLLKTAEDTADEPKEIEAMEWKHNALRHTYISARVAESGDIPRVADEAGNSPQVIRTNYLKRIRPAMATEWFSIKP
ncbi:MAG TPA: tyrosine-type recombinase/integrase [Candidatus Acidoferrales bacterium]|jgi:integrase|nr:tyrosine-type recombinase/integrase [Candidatus Acidoferrales bacterium]